MTYGEHDSDRDGWVSDYLSLVEDCEDRQSLLSEWEADFIASIRDQLEEGRRLSPKQEDKLDSIWEKATKGG